MGIPLLRRGKKGVYGDGSMELRLRSWISFVRCITYVYTYRTYISTVTYIALDSTTLYEKLPRPHGGLVYYIGKDSLVELVLPNCGGHDGLGGEVVRRAAGSGETGCGWSSLLGSEFLFL